jgi:hypothetical protein
MTHRQLSAGCPAEVGRDRIDSMVGGTAAGWVACAHVNCTKAHPAKQAATVKANRLITESATAISRWRVPEAASRATCCSAFWISVWKTGRETYSPWAAAWKGTRELDADQSQ